MFKNGVLSFSRKGFGVLFDRFICFAYLVVNVMNFIYPGSGFNSNGCIWGVSVFNMESVGNLVFELNGSGNMFLCDNNVGDRRSDNFCLDLLGELHDLNGREN